MAMHSAAELRRMANPRMLAMLLLGFSSGLPLALTSGTLQAWLAVAGVDIRDIGLFALVGLPYTLKFLWSPLMDRFIPPRLGRRRGWMLLTQACLALALAGMALGSPGGGLVYLALLALLVAFLSASQDIAVDAYRTDVLPPPERGLGAAVSVAAYRLAMLVSGAVALILSDQIGWRNTYLLMAGLMGVGMLASLLGPEPVIVPAPTSLRAAVLEPFKEFSRRRAGLLILLMIVLYKLGDAFAGTLTTAFLIKDLGFTPTDVGVINKGLGLLATLFGALAGGTLMIRLGLYRALMWFGILQAVTNLGFMALALAGHSYLGMVLVIAAENLAGGMGTAAFVALLMALCNHRYSATQYALLSALAAIGRVFVGPPAGQIVAAWGWPLFFLGSFVIALPGLLLLYLLREHVIQRDASEQEGTTPSPRVSVTG